MLLTKLITTYKEYRSYKHRCRHRSPKTIRRRQNITKPEDLERRGRECILRQFSKSNFGVVFDLELWPLAPGVDHLRQFTSKSVHPFSKYHVHKCDLELWLVAWYSGRTLVFDRRTFPVLRSTYSYWVNTYVSELSDVDVGRLSLSSFRGR